MRKNTQSVNRLLRETAEQRGKLIAAHRGTCGGHIVENTTGGFECALRSHADIVELDVARSTDGELFIFHDGNEKRLLGADRNLRTMSSEEILSYVYKNQVGEPTRLHVNTLDEALSYLKGRCLINVDRSWWYWADVLPCIERHDMLDQCIVKSDPEPELLAFMEKYEAPILYMAKAFCAQDVENVLARNINTVAFECIYFDMNCDVLEPELQKSWHELGVLLWTNALRLQEDWNRSAWHDDNGAILGDPDDHWGWQATHGFDIIQTDWPMMLHEYLVARGMRYQKKSI